MEMATDIWRGQGETTLMISLKLPNNGFEHIESYEDFLEKGHSWTWCLVGNIAEKHEYGEEHEIMIGTKHFAPGTKVLCAPTQWGDGYENIVVIGSPRHGSPYVEIVTRSKHVENFRMQKVYKPSILKRMCLSKYSWWGDTEEDRKEIIKYLEYRNPEEAAKEKAERVGRWLGKGIR